MGFVLKIFKSLKSVYFQYIGNVFTNIQILKVEKKYFNYDFISAEI